MDTHRQHTRLLATIIVLAMSAGPSWAINFAGGTGEPNDPYQIATPEQLIAMGQDPDLLDKHFALVNDIDLHPYLSPAYAFDRSVIDDEFDGVFDGNGFAIRHLTITAEDDGYGKLLGLFSKIGVGGQVKHLVLEDAEVLAEGSPSDAGTICGWNYGRIIGCAVSGIVLAHSTAGGLAALNDNSGSIEECSSFCAVWGGQIQWRSDWHE